MLAIDHLVIASKSPKNDAETFAKRHDVTVLEGGKHENWGTFNYLAFFHNDCYIEWLGVFDDELARKSDNLLIKRTVSFLDEGKDGLLTYALRTSDMNGHLKYFQENNMIYHGPFPGERKRTDGSVLSWNMLFPEGNTLPFLIQWQNGINLPAHEKDINGQTLHTVRVPGQIKDYEKTFGLIEENERIQLENGTLQFHDQLEFFIKDGK